MERRNGEVRGRFVALASMVLVVLGAAVAGCSGGGGGGGGGIVGPPPPATDGTVSGHVYDATDGMALAGVTVSCGTLRDTTDALGAFAMADVPAGSVTVVAGHAGYVDGSAAGTLDAGATLVLDLRLARQAPPPAVPGELEPNGSPAEANVLAMGGTVRGHIGPNSGTAADDAVDWFRLHASANGLLRIAVVNEEAAGTSGAGVGVVRLRNEALDVLESNGSYTLAGQRDLLRYVPVSAGADYLLDVNALSGSMAHYRIETVFEPATIADVGEPANGTRAGAMPLPEGSMNATIGYEGDAEDWYAIVGPASGSLKIQLTNLHPASVVVRGAVGRATLEQADGTVLASNGSYTVAGQSDAIGPHAVTPGVVYYLHVKRLDTLSAAPYRMDVIP